MYCLLIFSYDRSPCLFYGGDLLMKAYILSIAGVVLLSAVITIIAPSGKMGKFLRGAVKLVCGGRMKIFLMKKFPLKSQISE